MFTIQYTNDDGGMAVAMAMLSPPPTKPTLLNIQGCIYIPEYFRALVAHIN